MAPWLIAAALDDEDSGVRFLAANRLHFGRQDIERVKPAILKALNDADANVRWAVCMGVGQLGRDALSLIPVFQRLLIDRPADAQKWQLAINGIEYRSLVDR